MKLPFKTYNPAWETKFNKIKNDLHNLLKSINPQIDHIGSTSVKGLSAKPIIDIQIGVKNQSELDKIPFLLQLPNIVYYENYNKDMPTRRFFVVFTKSTEDMGTPSIIKLGESIPDILHNHDLRIAHIHAFIIESKDWTRHIAFRDYLRTHPLVTAEYQKIKEDLIKIDWQNGNEYNEGKNSFLKKHEQIALEWYKKIHNY